MYQCDTCHMFVDQSGLGYRDESRTECRDCHNHDCRRCDDSQEPEMHCEVCGDTRLESDLDGELRCPPCRFNSRYSLP